MKSEEFTQLKKEQLIQLLEEEGLSNTQFAKLTQQKSSANISNWKKSGNIPLWVESWLVNYNKAKKWDAQVEKHKKSEDKNISAEKDSNSPFLTPKYVEGLLNLTPLTQRDFCKRIGISHNGVEKWKKTGFPLWVEGWLKGYIARESLEYYLSGLEHMNKMRSIVKPD